MSILKLGNSILTQETDIQQELACLNIQIKSCDLENSLGLEILTQDVLTYLEKEQILQSHKSFFESYQPQADKIYYDLLILHPGSPNLYSLAATYGRYHIHTDVEALYVLSGEAIFGFVRPDGSQIELLLQTHDYIYIPPGCEHWFSPAASLHFKAVRYFTTANGWIPQHTGRTLKLGIS
jgi:1,2-dihydroxy-3-keto-5-methylthiopentene dioxygenase